jgi:tetratricopeptide (TPR) repeat protein
MTAKQAVGLVVSLLVAAPPARAAGQALARCELKPGHRLVNQGVLYLKSANETKFQDQKQKDLKDAYRVLSQAVASEGQEKNPAAWYYLARYYAMESDLGGADTAFAHALALVPKCKDDIELWRRSLWVPAFNSGVQAWQAGNTDSAIASFRRANQIYTAEPMGFTYIATLLSGTGQPDSAAKYFKLAARYAESAKLAAIQARPKSGSDSQFVADTTRLTKEKRDAMFNVARVYHAADRLDEAAAAYREYLGAYGGDVQAMAGLAATHSRAGRKDSATALFTQVIERADSAGASDLFGAGQTILNGIPQPPDTAPVAAQCKSEARKNRALTARQVTARCDSAVAKALRDFDASIMPQYQVAARAYEAGLAKNPYDRDALFNLSGLYYILSDTARALPVATRLYGLDPLNRSVLAKVAGAYQLRKKTDSTLYYLQQGEAVAVEVTVGTFRPDEKEATVGGLLTNIRDKPNAPFKVTFELLNAQGGVVTTQSVDVPAIEPGGNQRFDFKATGQEIVGWRYRKT